MNTWGGNITVSRQVVGNVQVKYHDLQSLISPKNNLRIFLRVDVKVWTGKRNFTFALK